MNKLKQIKANKIELVFLIVAFFFAYLIFQNFFETHVSPVPLSQPMWATLDPSWGLALNYANAHNLEWGKDITFTYGPLSYLCTRISLGENKYLILLYDLFVLLNYFLIFFLSLKRSKNKIITILSLLAICLIIPSWSGYAGSIILMGFLIFWVRMSLDNPKKIFYFFQISILVLTFFIKFNTGLIAFPIFFSGIFYNLIAKKEKVLVLIIYSLLPILSIFLLSYFLNVSLISYMKSGIEMVSGYNEIMYLQNSIPKSVPHMLILLFLSTFLMFHNINVLDMKKGLKNLVILFLFSISFFVTYKQAFTRADGHIYDFFLFILLILFFNVDLHFNANKWYAKGLYIVLLLIPFNFLIIENNRELEIANKLTKSNYVKEFNAYTQTSGNHLFPNNSQLPLPIVQKIGNKTVDIFPWNIQLLLLNKLNYIPRPVIQSYTAYTHDLEKLNFDHYNSDASPEYIIFDLESIDGRYPFFDESKVYLSLMKNYTIDDTFDFDARNLLLLKKRQDFKPIKLVKIKEYAMLIDSPLIPKEGVFYEIGVYNNLKGKIISIVQHAPEIRIEITTEEGQKSDYKTSKALLESGIFCDRLISTTKGFSSIFDNEQTNPKIKYYKLIPLQSSKFKDKIRVTEFKITR